jgi:hypothetical protein
MHDLVIRNALLLDAPGQDPLDFMLDLALGVHGVWVNGVRDLESLPGRMLREFSA